MQNNNDSGSGDLSGIPGVGPARRAAFEAAGVSTRAALARMDAVQIVSVSGMGRAQAEAALAFVQGALAEANEVTEAAPSTSDDGDEAFPPAATGDGGDTPPPSPEKNEDALPAEAQASRVERAIFAARTALSDVTRIADDARLTRQLTRLAVLLDETPARAERLRPKAAREVAENLARLAARLERNAVRLATETKREREKRTVRLRDRLKTDRQTLVALLGTDKKPARRRAADARKSPKK